MFVLSVQSVCKAEILAKFDEPQDEWSVKNYGDGWLSTFGGLKKNKTAQGVTYGSYDGSSGIEAWRYDHTAFQEVTVEITFMRELELIFSLNDLTLTILEISPG